MTENNTVKERKEKIETTADTPRRRVPGAPRHFRFSIFTILKDVTAQILILDDVCKLSLDVGGVELDRLFLHFRRLKGDLLEDLFENRMQAARADVFGMLVYARGVAGDGRDGVVAERKLEAFGIEESDVLLDEGVFRFREDAHEIRLGKRAELDADGEAPLQLRNQ